MKSSKKLHQLPQLNNSGRPHQLKGALLFLILYIFTPIKASLSSQ